MDDFDTNQGCAVILQGRYIEHQALRAFGQTERITSVTSFRPKNHTLPDDTVLTTVRAVSDLSELYFQFSHYRLRMLQDRVRDQVRKLEDLRLAGKKMDTSVMKQWLQCQEKFLAQMDKEWSQTTR